MSEDAQEGVARHNGTLGILKHAHDACPTLSNMKATRQTRDKAPLRLGSPYTLRYNSRSPAAYENNAFT